MESIKKALQAVYRFIRNHWKKLLMALLLIVVSTWIYRKMENQDFDLTRAVILGDPDKIIVINADESQDVIIVGDPDKINVKPKTTRKYGK